MIRGKADESYAKLPTYLHRIKEMNFGSVTDFVTDSDENFKTHVHDIGSFYIRLETL